MNDATDNPIPQDFWKQIDHQLDRIANEHPDTFIDIKAILDDPAYNEIQSEIHRNGTRIMPRGQSFFSGSGGDRSLASALVVADWMPIWTRASYHYAMRHRFTGDRLTYIEGDLITGDHR